MEGTARELGMDRYTLLYLKRQPTRMSYIAHGTLLSVMWQPEWEGSLGWNGHTCIYGLVPSLST